MKSDFINQKFKQMAYIHHIKPWDSSKIKPTDEKIYLNRREIVKQLGILSTGAIASSFLLSSCNQNLTESSRRPKNKTIDKSFYFEGIEAYFPAQKNESYTLDRPMTKEYDATHHNNFYEFNNQENKNIREIYKYVGDFNTSDWKFEVSGMAEKTGIFNLEDLIKQFGQEERTYRFRCVERWAMAVPWTGFPLKKLIDYLKPTNQAKYIKMVSAYRPYEMPGVKWQKWYPWPYQEGLRMDEALNELSFIATGLYGKPLPKQNGAPMRLVVPWKYGYKNIKSIRKIEFTDQQPATFWNTTTPDEYPFLSNVNPNKPHPRWSQAQEYMIPDGAKRPTLIYNGYGDYVAKLYSKG